MTEPSRLRGRGWPVVVLAALIVLVMFAVLVPAGELFAEQDDEVAQARQDLVLYRAQIAARPRLEQELKALNRQDSLSSALLRGGNTALAAASMQSLVKTLVESHSGQVRSAQTLSASIFDGLEKVEVQYELSIPLGSLKAATYDLESKTPYLFLDSVEVRPEIYGSEPTSAPSNLHVQWTIHGYRRVEVQ